MLIAPPKGKAKLQTCHKNLELEVRALIVIVDNLPGEQPSIVMSEQRAESSIEERLREDQQRTQAGTGRPATTLRTAT